MTPLESIHTARPTSAARSRRSSLSNKLEFAHRGRTTAQFRQRRPDATVLDAPEPHDVIASIRSDADIVSARARGRALAGKLGFSATDRVLIAAAISELARNILEHAQRGEISIGAVQRQSARGIDVIARDEGPGINNVEFALKDGFSTSGGLGIGLPGVRRLMDGFQIETCAGKGTAVRVTKWLKEEVA